MREKDRMHGRRTPAALLRRERPPQAAGAAPHVLPELVEVVGGRRAREPRLQLRRQVLVRGLGVHEHRGAERLTVPTRHLDRVEHVQEADRLVVGHVGVPVLTRVGDPDRLAVLDDVREVADFRHAGLVVPARERCLDLSEAPGEVTELDGLELLAGKAQHTVTAEGFQNRPEVRVAQGFGKIHPPDRRSQDLPARLDGRHAALLTAWRDYTAPGSLVLMYARQAIGTGRTPTWR